ncbi:KpsF/GutQ family sugar-phosphate isomerase [Chitinibacter bivalviorum]|uniref:Arabinose 5-phosphate isomerase KdsD n=1 Tax=Chitinibacter bivalviorum TaxID=2739434 RepID=A0A7H9BF37_9NEIS|nr:KpsF/GutQ family sugar-phosphate isomerase [Chitinibacter bivalviorum]QLG87032.1 KpsF/GutQ family sugar-phosphate isomerase [Chitinibacter bivalviorum]
MQSAHQTARRVLAMEAAAIEAIGARLDDGLFEQACQLVLACQGRVVVMGMGKSGHIARKIAATMASTGTPAIFVHPGEAAHGDLGMITRQDMVLILSNSGESDEVLAILPSLKRLAVPIISMTGAPQSTLAQEANVHLDAGVAEEACPLNLAPTASTTAALALGDALAVALLEARGFQADDFALSHPGGSLGRRLLVHVRDLMHAGDKLPVVQETMPLRDALLEISRKGLGMTAVVDAAGQLQGVYTDGDLRRTLDRDVDLRATKVSEVMTRNPATIEAQRLAAEAAAVMEGRRINGLLVLENGQLVGALNMHDLLKARVV